MLQPGADPVRKVSIIPRGRAPGVTLSTPEQDRYGFDAEYLKGRMVGALGGMAAERVVFGVITSGSESDLQTCTAIARSMVGRWGMSERIGPMSVFQPDADPRMSGVAEATLDAVDQEVRRLIEEAYDRAIELLTQHRARLDRVVAQLLERETLDEAEVYAAAGLAHGAAGTPDFRGAMFGRRPSRRRFVDAALLVLLAAPAWARIVAADLGLLAHPATSGGGGTSRSGEHLERLERQIAEVLPGICLPGFLVLDGRVARLVELVLAREDEDGEDGRERLHVVEPGVVEVDTHRVAFAPALDLRDLVGVRVEHFPLGHALRDGVEHAGEEAEERILWALGLALPENDGAPLARRYAIRRGRHRGEEARARDQVGAARVIEQGTEGLPVLVGEGAGEIGGVGHFDEAARAARP
jgi:hypothetical protein